MASSLVDLVKINITSTGTGALKLGTAATGYRGVEALTNGREYSYSIQQGSNWEVGRGTYLAASNQIVRSVLFSSAGGSAIKLTAGAQVAFTALSEDLDAVQLTADAQAAAAQAAANAAQVATDRASVEASQAFIDSAVGSVVYGMRVYANAYASTLPKGVRSGTIGGTAITGATVGTYALTPVGGSITGVVANLVVTSATLATIQIVNPGLGSGTTPPTWANPAGATIPAGTTLTAVVSSLIDDQQNYWAISSDGLSYLLCANSGGSFATAPVGGTQTTVPTGAGLNGAVSSISSQSSLITSLGGIIRWIPGNTIRFGDAAGNYVGEINANGINVSEAGLSSALATDLNWLRGFETVARYIPGAVVRTGDMAGNYVDEINVNGGGTGSVSTTTSGGKTQVVVGGTIISDGTANDDRPVLSGTHIRFESDRIGSAFAPFRMSPLGKNVVRALASKKLTLILSYGQSLSIGTSPSVGVALTTASNPGTALMFNRGVRPIGTAQTMPSGNTIVVADADIDRLVPMAAVADNSTYAETHLETLAYRLAGSGLRTIGSAPGIGGATIAQLSKGTVPYSNALKIIQRARDIAVSLGYDLEVVVDFIHGNADNAATRAAYKAAVVQLYTDFTTDICALTEQAALHMFIRQVSTIAASQVPLAQWEASKENANIHLSAPDYDLPYTADNTHPTSVGYTYMGDQEWRAMKAVMIDGATWKPLQPVQAGVSRVGAVVTIPIEGGTGNLAIDTTLVSSIANYGAVYSDDSSSAGISSVTVGASAITVTLTATPTGANKTIRFGWFSGARTNITDSDTLTATRDGRALPKRLVISEVTFA